MAQGFTDRDVTDQTGRTFIVTGANTGIGFETARVLARRGARVLLGCRSEQRAEDAMAKIRAETAEADLQFLPLDQADLASVRAAAEQAAAEPRLDVLSKQRRHHDAAPHADRRRVRVTVRGQSPRDVRAHRRTSCPSSKKRRAAGSSSPASLAHRGGRIHWNDIDGAKLYGRQARYQQSKLANLLHTFELDRRLKARGSRTIAVACHPGLAQTEIGRNFPLIQFAKPLVRAFFNTQAMGAWPTLMAATAPERCWRRLLRALQELGRAERSRRQGLVDTDQPRPETRQAALGAVGGDDGSRSGDLSGCGRSPASC